MLFDILTEVRGSQLNEPSGFSGCLPPLVLSICYCIYIKVNKYDNDIMTMMMMMMMMISCGNAATLK